MTIYKALKNLSHIRTGELLKTGSFCSDNNEAEDATAVDVNGVIWRDGYLSRRSQNDINVLLGYALDIVDEQHDDYDRLIDAGIITHDEDEAEDEL